jgi:hypothetical protein
MPKHQELPAEVGDRRRDVRDAMEHIIQADEIIAKTGNNAGDRLKVARSLLRTASRLLEGSRLAKCG